MPREQEIAETGAVPGDLRKQAAEMRLFGYAFPREWGGLGLDLSQHVELATELGYTSLALRSMFGTNNGIAGRSSTSHRRAEAGVARADRLGRT